MRRVFRWLLKARGAVALPFLRDAWHHGSGAPRGLRGVKIGPARDTLTPGHGDLAQRLTVLEQRGEGHVLDAMARLASQGATGFVVEVDTVGARRIIGLPADENPPDRGFILGWTHDGPACTATHTDQGREKGLAGLTGSRSD